MQRCPLPALCFACCAEPCVDLLLAIHIVLSEARPRLLETVGGFKASHNAHRTRIVEMKATAALDAAVPVLSALEFGAL